MPNDFTVQCPHCECKFTFTTDRAYYASGHVRCERCREVWSIENLYCDNQSAETVLYERGKKSIEEIIIPD